MAKKNEDVSYPKCECTNVKNRNWIFWLIFLGMVGYLIWYVITTIEELKTQIPDFEEMSETIRMTIGVINTI